MNSEARRFGTTLQGLRGSAMGDVILFRLRTGQSRKNNDCVARAGAQIVFFTGVRYGRMPEALPAPGAVDSGAPSAGGVGGAGSRRRRRRA
jgi:hypothetical protein